MARHVSRRRFLQTSSALGAAALTSGVWSERALAASKSPNEKLNLAFVGVANQARFSIDNLTSQNIFALCDVDDNFLDEACKRFPAAKRHNDFRKMLDAEKSVDAVVVATPDHIHAPATLAALKMGKHVYCEKPLTHTVQEAAWVLAAAEKAKVATQMGTQIHAGENYRRVVEIIQSGAIGQVKEVHTWVGAVWGGVKRPTEALPVPKNIHWDLWLGPAAERPFHTDYLPAKWRRFWDFGGGGLADMACHHIDLPFWALGIREPLTIAAEGPAPDADCASAGITVKYEFAARGEQPPVTLTWYDGNKIPRELVGIKNLPGAGNLFLGEKGQLWADYGSFKLYPEEKFREFKLPAPTIARSLGHHAEWVKACKEGTPTTCNFSYAVPLTTTVLLGNVAYRSGKKIEWDAKTLSAKNCPEAEPLLRKKYRAGWELS